MSGTIGNFQLVLLVIVVQCYFFASYAPGMFPSTPSSELPCQMEAPVVVGEEVPPHDPCQGYDGVLRIRSGDEGAAAGTVFFLYMVNHLLYAEMYNLLPWVHLDNTSHRIYDPVVHGAGSSHTFTMLQGEIDMDALGVPQIPNPPTGAEPTNFTITGNGVWESYFEPLSDFSPLRNRTCWKEKPLYEIDYFGVSWGLHGEAEWSVRAWWYGPIKKSDIKKTVREWYRPMRLRGASVVGRYIRPKPWLQEAAERANPMEPDHRCLAMHVRTTDKALSGGRMEIQLDDYLPYVEKFLDNNPEKSHVYLATDSESTLIHIQSNWPHKVARKVITQANAFHSNSSDPTFDLVSHHRTNTEVLVDIYAMAKCSVFLHGRSAVSEAVLYLNPELRHGSFDLKGDNETLQALGWN